MGNLYFVFIEENDSRCVLLVFSERPVKIQPATFQFRVNVVHPADHDMR